jgi:hypothetical protein
MNSTYVLIALGGVAVGFLVNWLLARAQSVRQGNQIRQVEASLKDREREAFRIEREHREEIKRLGAEHSEALKREHSEAFDQGRELGQTEGQRDHIREITTKESEFEERLRKECKRAADEAREQARMQFEQQQKLFSVEVRPYFEITEVGTYFKTKYEKRVGYQYQLLVNGIPALQPHVITESKEVVEKTKDENIDKIASQALQAAQLAAQGAIDTYLGGAGTFVRLGKVMRRLPGIGK